jgi:DNA-binding transcriptional ArsR family regulator
MASHAETRPGCHALSRTCGICVRRAVIELSLRSCNEVRMEERMDDAAAVVAFVALGHETRLSAYRRLVAAGPEGVASGELAAALGVPATAMSFHLAALERAGLASARRYGRNVIYTADFAHMRGLVAYLTADCCGGRPEICEGLAIPAPMVAPGCSKGGSVR